MTERVVVRCPVEGCEWSDYMEEGDRVWKYRTTPADRRLWCQESFDVHFEETHVPEPVITTEGEEQT